jgi:hypothetical protein
MYIAGGLTAFRDCAHYRKASGPLVTTLKAVFRHFQMASEGNSPQIRGWETANFLGQSLMARTTHP